MFGDNNGDYNSGSFPLGNHTLTVTPYSGPNATGTPGTPYVVNFSVTNSAARISERSSVKTVCFPNPSSDFFNINISASESGIIMVDVLNLYGVVSENLFDKYVSAGEDVNLTWVPENI